MAPYFMVPALRRLANKSIDIAEFYYATAIKLLGKAGLVENRNHLSYFSGTDESGLWQDKFSGILKAIFRTPCSRCITFKPYERQNLVASRVIR